MLRLALPALAVAALSTGCIIETDDDATLSVHNDSDYALVELHLAEVNDRNWGPNLLGSRPLYPGASIGIGVDCGYYDVMVVDDTGVDCTLTNLDLCANSDSWVVDNFTLDVCAFNPYKPTTPTK